MCGILLHQINRHLSIEPTEVPTSKSIINKKGHNSDGKFS